MKIAGVKRPGGAVASCLLLFAAVALSVPVISCETKTAPVTSDAKAGSISSDTRQPGSVSYPGSLKLRDTGGEKVVTVSALVSEWGTEEIESQDDYYHALKRYHAIALAPLIKKYFKLPLAELQGAQFLVSATDGYAVRIAGSQLLHPAAYLAVADAEHDDWQPIGERGVSPAPLYMVWKGTKFADKEKYPRPWALAQIELLSGADRYAHTRPPTGFAGNTAAKKGYEIFDENCIRCHSINQEGGTLGPELNIPQNILAYRPEQQVRAYIKDPRTFRYSAMPPHPQFSEQDLDDLIAYLKLMAEHQHDPHEKSKAK